MDTPTLLFDRYRRCGDLDALGRAFDLLSPRLLALALHLTGNAADAEDALQATFVVAMQKAAAFDATKEVGPWLAGVLAGEANNLRRREQRRRTEALEEALVGAGAGDVVDDAERRELVAQLRTRIDALPDEQRQVLLLQLQHGLRPAEIAEVLGIAPGTVRMRLHRGLDALRKVLPAGLVALLVAGTARRGLAAVREAVLQAGAQSALVAGGGVAAATIGGVMLKKFLVAAGVLAAGLLLWRTLTPPDAVVAPTPATDGALAAVGDLAKREAQPTSGDAATASMQREAATPAVAPDASASLLVTVRVCGPYDDDPMVADLLIPDDESAPPLPGIVVELGRAGTGMPRIYDPRVQRVAVDRAGQCRFEGLAPGKYLVEVERGGMLASERVQLAPGEAATLGLMVEIAGTARGRVVDADGRPVPGAEIWIGGRFDPFTPPHKAMREAAVCDGAGRFTAAFRKGEQYVSARGAGFTASRSRSLQQLGEGEIVLVLGRQPASLRGLLVDEVGQPVADATVSLEPADDTFREPRRDADGALIGPRLGVVTRSDERGTFFVDGLTADVWSLRVARAPNETIDQRLRFAAGEQRQLRLTMARRAVVSGRVVRSDGRPCRNVYVAVSYPGGSSQPGLTDDDGAFWFSGVRLEPFELLATRTGSKEVARRAMPAPTPEGVEVELVYDEPPLLFGTLRAHDGLRLSGWFVSIGEGAEQRREPCDAEGRFQLVDVTPGAHTVRVYRRGVADEQPVLTTQVVADQVADLRVPLEAMPFGEVRCRVLDPDGAPLRDGVVDMPYAGFKEGSATGDGTFRFSQLLPGTHWLRALAPDCVAMAVPIELGERESLDVGTLQLVRAATLRVRYTMVDGTPWRGRPPTPHLRDGKGEFRTTPDQVRYRVDGDEVVVVGVAPGRYTILGGPIDELLTTPTDVTLAAGEQRSVTVTLTLGRRRTFRIGELDGIADADGCVRVVLLDADGDVVDEDRLHVQDGAAIAAFVVPVGRATVEAHVGERVVARRAFEVGPELVEAPRLDVPRVR
ncbi:MAG: sigma-70 family RNA polymerase sigma factor [Planctomycetes bacterium]|nr:sigma-70 family RNA polymerase sigma factor [Planctomycetota bacterium]